MTTVALGPAPPFEGQAPAVPDAGQGGQRQHAAYHRDAGRHEPGVGQGIHDEQDDGRDGDRAHHGDDFVEAAEPRPAGVEPTDQAGHPLDGHGKGHEQEQAGHAHAVDVEVVAEHGGDVERQ